MFLVLIFFFVAVIHSPKSRLIQLKKEKLEYTPGEHEHGLFPAPIHVGGYFMCVLVVGRQVLHLGDMEVVCLDVTISLPLSLFSFFFILSPCQVTHVFQHMNFAKDHINLSVFFSAKVFSRGSFFFFLATWTLFSFFVYHKKMPV